jgi:hypothetical protein
MSSSDSLSYAGSIVFVMLGGHKDSKSPRIVDALVLPVIYYLCSYTICDSDSQGFGGLVLVLFVEVVRSIRDLLSSGSIFCGLVLRCILCESLSKQKTWRMGFG